MIKICVLSDTHGNSERAEEIIKKENCNYNFFLGDCLADVKNYIGAPNFKAVSGNCDFFSKEKNSSVFTIGGVKFLITHGHYYFTKSGLGSLLRAAEKFGVQVVCFGHTHTYLEEHINGILFVNPGALSKVRGGENTYAILEIENGNIKVTKKEI